MARKPDIARGALEALLSRVFGPAVSFERTAEGVSTQVYRVFRGDEVFYLRIAEEPDDNLETDALVHHELRRRGVKVAEVIHVDPFDDGIGRSTMVTTAVAGAATEHPSAAVVEAAGADLAVINQLPVRGWGFVRRRGHGWPLEGAYRDHVSSLPSPWPGRLAELFDPAELAVIEDLLPEERAGPAVLNHGDFDLTQVFHDGGRYSGLIDFGEIRGAEPFFDLGHFALHHDAELAALLVGYQRVRPLSADHLRSIRRSAILLGCRQLWGWLAPPRNRAPSHPVVSYRTEQVKRQIHRRSVGNH
ncbi:phosphotransferase [Asanoa ferruginea]|uniref:phosphotransferase n=1 Tax=Asanoa ferruginea TaxID=53367 RepID=UPI0014769821|nr:phosphotransferase [Asanoa ferruginea]